MTLHKPFILTIPKKMLSKHSNDGQFDGGAPITLSSYVSLS
jgi:hypothetical protein